MYCLQARPCIFRPGNFTGWGSEGDKAFRLFSKPLIALHSKEALSTGHNYAIKKGQLLGLTLGMLLCLIT